MKRGKQQVEEGGSLKDSAHKNGSCFLKLFITAKPWYAGKKEKKKVPCGSLATKNLTACLQGVREDGPKYFPQQEKWESSASC